MTEAEAKQKWCPFARAIYLVPEVPVAINRGSEGKPSSECRCIGSLCMAWRERVYPDPTTSVAKTDGYCGLAGNPHDLI